MNEKPQWLKDFDEKTKIVRVFSMAFDKNVPDSVFRQSVVNFVCELQPDIAKLPEIQAITQPDFDPYTTLKRGKNNE